MVTNGIILLIICQRKIDKAEYIIVNIFIFSEYNDWIIMNILENIIYEGKYEDFIR